MTTVRETAIKQLVISRLHEDFRTSGQPIDVTVLEGDIFLIGTCDTEEQRKIALLITRGIAGVRTVIDNIRVRKIAQAI